MSKHLENLTKAAQCASLLAADISSAHAAACVSEPLPSEMLLTDALLPLLGEARELEKKIKRLQSCFQE